MYPVDQLDLCTEIFKLYHIRLQLFSRPYKNPEMIDFGLRSILFEEYDYNAILDRIHSVLRPGAIVYFQDSAGISYNAFSLQEGPAASEYEFGVLGPWKRGSTAEEILEKLNDSYSIPEEKNKQLLPVIQRIPENMNREKWINLCSRIIGRLISPDGNVSFYVPEEAFMVNDSPARQAALKKRTQYAQLKNEHLRNGFTNQSMLMKAVRSGNYAQATDYIYRYLNFQIKYRQNNGLSADAVFYELNSLLRYAAVQAGVNALRLDEIYLKYDRLADQHPSAEEIPCTMMVRDYCDVISKYAKQYSPVVSSCVDYIDFFYSDPITLQELAERNSVSVPYLSSLFSSEIGMTFTDYLNQTRISHAKAMLMHSPYSIQEISARCGYNDSSYFTRVFKKLTGTSPLKYRAVIHMKSEAAEYPVHYNE